MYFILTFLCDYSFKAGIRNDNDDICIILLNCIQSVVKYYFTNSFIR